jgi:ABC-type transport system substrate-binding protein
VKRFVLVVGAVLAAAAPAGASHHARVVASAAERRARNIVVWGLYVAGGATTPQRGATTRRGAFRLDTYLRLVPDLAVDAHADARGVSYTIDPNAFWYWGGRKVPVTYRDFVYTLQQVDDPKNQLQPGAGMGNLDPTRFTHVGDKHVTFYWRTTNCSDDFPCGPYANWRSLFTDIYAPYPSFALNGVDLTKVFTTCVCGSDGKPVADEAFYEAAYAAGQGETFKPNPYWDGAKPALAEVDFSFFSDLPTMIEALRQGSIDATSLVNAAQITPELETTSGLTIVGYHGGDSERLYFREADAPGGPTVTKGSSNVLLRAPWMRQAMALGLDRRALISAYLPSAAGLAAGYVKPADDLLFGPGQAGYRADFARWDYARKKALAILKAHCTSGPSVPNPTTTKVWQCCGLPAVFRWTWTASRTDRTAIEQVAKAELRAIGISIVERPLPANVIFTPQGVFSGDYDIADVGELAFDPGDFTEEFRCRGKSNFTGFCSAKVDALLRAGDAEFDPAKRLADFQAADVLLADSVPELPLFSSPGVLIHKTALLGLDRPGEQFDTLQNWRWKR